MWRSWCTHNLFSCLALHATRQDQDKTKETPPLPSLAKRVLVPNKFPPSLPLLFVCCLERPAQGSNHIPQDNQFLSPLLFPGGYCPTGSSAVTSCPAGAIEWDAHLPLLSSRFVCLCVFVSLSFVLCFVVHCHRQLAVMGWRVTIRVGVKVSVRVR